MERQFVRKNGITHKRRSIEAQNNPSSSKDLTPGDGRQPGQTLINSTARSIGSMLGKIVARSENSFNRRKPRIEPTPTTTVISHQKTSANRKSSDVSEENVSKAVSKTQVKHALSVRRSPSKNLKRQSRANRPTSRKTRSD